MHREHYALAACDFSSSPKGQGPGFRVGRADESFVAPGKLRLLIVEDEALIALNMEGALLQAGFDVVGIADTEEQAVETASGLRPDVVLMDIALREGDGISAARRIRAHDSDVRVIFVSGNSDPATLATTSGFQPAGFIRKPFLSGQLAALVLQALGRSH